MAEIAMPTETFDPYGEVSPDTARDDRKAKMELASVMLDRAGQFVFWMLVVVIVSARVIWYPAGARFEVTSGSQPQHVVMR